MMLDAIHPHDAPSVELIDLRTVIGLTGMSRPTIYRRLAARTFPLPLKLSGGTIRWIKAEISDWQASLPRATYPEPRRGPASRPKAGRGGSSSRSAHA